MVLIWHTLKYRVEPDSFSGELCLVLEKKTPHIRLVCNFSIS